MAALRLAVLCCTLAIIQVFVLQPAVAQFKIHTWESFETGTIPSTLLMGHNADSSTILPYHYIQQNAPAEMLSGMANVECGIYGVHFKPSPDKKHLSVVSPAAMRRESLGSSGRALFQADFYLPAAGTSFPNTALLAIEVGGQWPTTSYKMYRFGISEGGGRLFFAYANDDINATKGAPLVYHHQNLSELNLKRPGWHRFQMIFTGQNEIVCAVDMQPTKFSPVRENSLRNLHAGVMVASTAGNNSCVVDNISIQWSFDDAPLPESPWIRPVTNGAVANVNYMESGSEVLWLSDPQSAWSIAQQQQRPILVQFYSPNVPPYNYLTGITPRDTATRELLNRFVLLKLDVNQLGGGTLGQRFNIVRVPTFLTMSPTGTELGRLPVVMNQTPWSEVQAFINSTTGVTSTQPIRARGGM